MTRPTTLAGTMAADDSSPLVSVAPAAVSGVSLEALYRSQLPRLRRFFARRAGGDDALDLTHDAFERLARRDEGEPALDHPENYLSRIAGNLLRDRAKFAARRAAAFHVPIDDVPLAAVDPHAQLEARDMIERLDIAMQRLPARTRDIFMACRLDGYTHAEIADHWGISVRGVRKQMGRAIAEIDRVLGEN